MSNNDNFKFPWLDQLQEFYDNSAKIIEDSAKIIEDSAKNLLQLDPIDTINSKTTKSDPKGIDTKIYPNKETKNKINEKEVIYDKFYNDFKINFNKINSFENLSNPAKINDEELNINYEKLNGIFNELLKKELNKKASPNIAESNGNLDKYELAFSIALTRLTSKEFYDVYGNRVSEVYVNRVSKDEFELLLSNKQELDDIITKKNPNQNKYDFQKKLSDPEKPTTENSKEWYDNIFSAPKQTLTTITSLFTGVISLIFEPTKTKDKQSQEPTRTPNKPSSLKPVKPVIR